MPSNLIVPFQAGRRIFLVFEKSVIVKDAVLEKPGSNQQGLILHLQRFSTEDGPGIRTTVFF